MDDKRPFMRSNRTLEIVLLGLGTIVGLFFASRYNYLLFHTLAEGFSITVASVMFVLAWNTWELTDHGYLKLLGVAFLFIGGLDLVHTLAYKGMGLFPGYDANLSTQLWIAARYVQALTLLIAPAFLHRKLRRRERRLLVSGYAILTAALLTAIFARRFPDCYIEDQGLTQFKIISEYLIGLLLVGAIWQLVRHRDAFASDIFRWLVAALAFTIISELAFTFYVSVYGLSNLIGHIFKIFAFYSIYRAIVETGLRKPYALIFRKLQERNERLAQEVTERKRAEDALRESEERHRAISELMSDFAYSVHIEADGTYISEWATKSIGAFTGYSRDEMHEHGDWPMLIYPDDRQLARQHYQTLIKGKADEVEFRIVTKDGETRWLSNHGQPVWDADEGRVVKIIGAAQDITERKRMEMRIRENEVRYKKAQRLGQVGNWEYDVQTARFWGSDEAKRIYGFDPAAEDFSTKEVERCIPERERVHQALIDLIEEDAEYNLEFEIHPKNSDQTKTIVSIAELERDARGNPLKVTGVIQDITERKRFEKSLRESREQYRILFGSFPLGITVADRDGEILEVNAEAEHLLGIPQEEHKQRQIDGEEWRIIRPDGSPMPAEEYASVRALQENRLIENVEMGIVKPDEAVTWINVTAAPLMDDRVVVTYDDITERKRAEDALRESEKRFRTIIDALPQFVSYTDKNLTYRFVSRTYQEKFGVASEEVVGKTLPEVIGEEAFEEARPHVEKALQGEQVRYHERYDYAIGGTRDIDGILVPDVAEDGTVRGYYAVLTDITPYMEMQEELRRTTGRLRILHDIDAAILRAQSPEEIAIAALERLYPLIPCRHTSIAEIDSSQQQGRDMIILVDGELQARMSNWRPLSYAGPQLTEAIRQGQPYIVHDMAAVERLSPLEQMLEAAGLRSYISIPLLVQNTPIGTLNLASEKPDFFQPEHVDILEDIAASLAVALQQAQLLEQTKQDAETKSLLLREVNHRVKNNLDAIIGLLYVERRHAPPDALPAYRSIMDDLTQRITGLAEVHQMLTGVEWAPLNLGELAERIIQITVRSSKYELNIELDITPSPVRVNPAQAQHLALILSELTTNTLKHSANSRDAVRIAVQIAQKDGIITLIYWNDGPGYPEDVLRLERHSAGLDIVKRSVRKNLQGELSLRNQNGAVTEIRFKAESRK